MARPMLDRWEMPGVEAIFVDEQRRLVEHAVPGRTGSLLQDMGSRPTRLIVAGSLSLDEDRDGFLQELRRRYAAAAPVTFVADIMTASSVSYVVIRGLEVQASAHDPSRFRYAVALVESPPPAPAGNPLDAVEEALGTEVDGNMAGLSGLGDLAAKAGLPDLSTLGEVLGDPPDLTKLTGMLAGLESPKLVVDWNGLLNPVGESVTICEQKAGELQPAVAGLDQVNNLAGPGPEAVSGDITGAAQSMDQARQALEGLPTADVAALAGSVDQLPRPDAAQVTTGAGAALESLSTQLDAAQPETALAPVTDGAARAETGLQQGVTAPLAELDSHIDGVTKAFGAAPEVEEAAAPLHAAADDLAAHPAAAQAEAADAQAAAIREQLKSGAPVGEVLAGSTGSTVTSLLLPYRTARTESQAKVAAALPGTAPLDAAEPVQQAFPALTARVRNADWTNDEVVNALMSDLEQLKTQVAAVGTAIRDAAGHVRNSLSGIDGDVLQGPLSEALGELRSLEIAPEDATGGALLDLLHQTAQTLESLDPAQLSQALISRIQEGRKLLQQFDVAGKLQQVQAGLNEVARIAEELAQARTRAFMAVQQMLTQTVKAAVDEAGSAMQAIRGELDQGLQAVKGGAGALKETAQQIQSSISQAITRAGQVMGEAKQAVESAAGKLRYALEDLARAVADIKPEEIEQAVQGELAGIVQELKQIHISSAVDEAGKVLDGLEEQIGAIDVSQLNPLARGALGAAKVLLIHEAKQYLTPAKQQLLDRYSHLKQEGPDKLIQDVETQLHDAVERFGQFDPTELIQPLQAAHDQLMAFLKRFSAETLMAPLNEAHARLEGAIAAVQPDELLLPVQQAFDALSAKVDRVDPTALLSVTQELRDRLEEQLDRLEVERLPERLAHSLQQLRQLIESVEPAQLLRPVREAVERLGPAIGRINPERLYEATLDLSFLVETGLESITDEALHALEQGLDAALQPLDELADAAADAIGEGLGDLEQALLLISPAKLTDALRTLWRDLKAAIDEASAPEDRQAYLLAARTLIRELDPLRQLAPYVEAHDLALKAVRLLRSEWAGAARDLQATGGRVRSIVLGALPAWMTERPILKERMLLNVRTTGFRPYMEALQEAYAPLERFRNGFPAQIDAVADALEGALDDLAYTPVDVDALTGPIVSAYTTLKESLLASLDLSDLAAEFDELQQELLQSMQALNPATMLQDLNAIWEEARQAVAALDPGQFAQQIDQVYREQVLPIAGAISPQQVLAPGIQETFRNLEQLMSRISVRNLIAPVTAEFTRLDKELQDGLNTIFRRVQDLPRAIPIDVPELL